ncbi:hypothetical protein HU200_066940 [Digitaria exilis]|uniref:Uncharacterized protein n=1 Tax=Digitaria exilis TaxID=1010633 RepID=A0A835A6T9_9POAL|nr:hypothetical protein HU200_066940 [Digitaria exilis]
MKRSCGGSPKAASSSIPALSIPSSGSEDSSGSEMLTDSEEDMRMGNRKPVPTGTDLCVFYLVDMEGVVYPVCPVYLWKSYQWETGEVMKEHIMVVATSNL